MPELLLEVGEVFAGCVRQKAAMGIPPGQARDACDEPDSSFQWPQTFFRSAASEAPESPEDEDEPKATPEAAEGRRGALEALGVALGVGPTRWGGRNLTPGFVPPGPDPRTEAHIWAKEVVRVGQRPPFQKEAWAVHAQRMGLTPEQAAKGWEYIETVFTSRFGRTVEDRAREVLREFSGQPYGGYYTPMPHELRVRMQGSAPTSWPWATKEAEEVFKAAQKYIAKHPGVAIETAFDAGLEGAGLTVFDLTPEDDAVMGIALAWEIQGKDAVPQAPEIPTARNAYGIKGRQVSQGHTLSSPGAP